MRPKIAPAILLAASLLAGPALAQGFVPIHHGEASRIAPYSDPVRGWRIAAARDAGGFSFCTATRGEDRNRVRIGSDGVAWQIAVVDEENRVARDGTILAVIDNRPWELQPVRVGNWLIARVPPTMYEQLRLGDALTVDIGGRLLRRDLAGSLAAMTRVGECVRRRGVSGG
ncbi:hypothetical protein [Histidinibacterium lentulum]|uniref:Uncharacterized protein n=1 Tax=Histidinibacterium lentulum TaxID=2480588 RepID=A0A3N2R9S6_9RHOB|nr:hypothetical protein [Histidinibacterium lentulum]ROU04214.1 hypothetical protein EAT49_02155 [Histidinibacterium lentulum]